MRRRLFLSAYQRERRPLAAGLWTLLARSDLWPSALFSPTVKPLHGESWTSSESLRNTGFKSRRSSFVSLSQGSRIKICNYFSFFELFKETLDIPEHAYVLCGYN